MLTTMSIAPERIECGLDDLRRGLRLGDVVMIGHRGASRGGGLGDELLGGRFSRWAAVNPGTDVVDDDERPTRSEDSGVLPWPRPRPAPVMTATWPSNVSAVEPT